MWLLVSLSAPSGSNRVCAMDSLPVKLAARWTSAAVSRAGRAALMHGGHQGFSRYLIDPLFTHHAILEDEARLNLIVDSRRTAAGMARVASARFEVAYAFTNAFGMEMFVPIDQPFGSPAGSLALGDVEVQPLKWSFLRHHDLIATTVLALTIPTGPGAQGTEVAPHLFVDAVRGRFAIQSNLAYAFGPGGEQAIEARLSVARLTFLSPRVSLGPLVELAATRGLAGGAGGESELGLVPGVKLQIGGWHTGLGMLLPHDAGAYRHSVWILTIGSHANWRRNDRTPIFDGEKRNW
jgi:hypothetical protein